MPAAALESAVINQLRAILRAPDLLSVVIAKAVEYDSTLDEAKVSVAITRLDAIWDQLLPSKQRRIVRLLVEKVIVSTNDIEPQLRANGIERLLVELRPAQVDAFEKVLSMTRTSIAQIGVAGAIPSSDGRLTLSIPIQNKCRDCHATEWRDIPSTDIGHCTDAAATGASPRTPVASHAGTKHRSRHPRRRIAESSYAV